MRGRFVAFEGIDGSGKSSTLSRVEAALLADGIDVVATREETESESGAWVRHAIAEHWDPLATALLFVADRVRHVPEIEAWRAEGRNVLCDRFVHSTFAYQTVTLDGYFKDPRDFLQRLHEGWCPLPDHVLLFSADPAKSLQRVHGRGAATPYEKVAFLERVQAIYLGEAKRDAQRFHVLDAERPIDEVAADALAIVRGWLQD